MLTENIDEWLKQRESGFVPKVQIPTTADVEVKDVQEELQKAWSSILDKVDKRLKLEPSVKECSECSKREQFYINDYICYICRDSLDEEE